MGAFIHLLNETANIELAIPQTNYCTVWFLQLFIFKCWDQITGELLLNGTTFLVIQLLQTVQGSIHISITVYHATTVELCLMDSPKKWLSTVLQMLCLQSPKYTFAYNQNVYSIQWTAPSVPTVLELYKVHSIVSQNCVPHSVNS